MADLPYFSAAQVKRKLSMTRAIGLMRRAFAQLSSGEAAVPIRTHMHLPEVKGEALFMPAYLAGEAVFGLKVVGMNPGNLHRGLPLIHAQVLVMDAQTGQALGMVDGTYLTALRTGAASGLATELLARPDAETVAIIGAGVQARTQLEAVCAVRPIRQAWVINRSRAHAEQFALEMSEALEVPVTIGNAKTALPQADIVCTATSASGPVFAPSLIRPGTHLNAVGAYRPDMAEIPADTVMAAQVFVDQQAAIWAEAGDLIQPMQRGLISRQHIVAELGEVVLEKHPGRENEDAITLFKSVGNAAQDLVVAAALIQSEAS